jgi:hypothetical protein
MINSSAEVLGTQSSAGVWGVPQLLLSSFVAAGDMNRLLE